MPLTPVKKPNDLTLRNHMHFIAYHLFFVHTILMVLSVKCTFCTILFDQSINICLVGNLNKKWWWCLHFKSLCSFTLLSFHFFSESQNAWSLFNGLFFVCCTIRLIRFPYISTISIILVHKEQKVLWGFLHDVI